MGLWGLFRYPDLRPSHAQGLPTRFNGQWLVLGLMPITVAGAVSEFHGLPCFFDLKPKKIHIGIYLRACQVGVLL